MQPNGFFSHLQERSFSRFRKEKIHTWELRRTPKIARKTLRLKILSHRRFTVIAVLVLAFP